MRWKLAGAGVCVLAACGVMMTSEPAPAGARYDTSAGPVFVERIADGFDTPWAVAFLPEGRLLVTELGGRLWYLDGPERREVAGLPPVRQTGQGGLMDVVAARDFATTRQIFLTYTAPDGNATRTEMAKARLSEDGARLDNVEVLYRQEPAIDSARHFGARVVEAPDGTLWITQGDRAERPMAQDTANTIGSVLRVARDGSVPADNPFAKGGGHPLIWSYGHRNPQGAALGLDGQLYTVSHGARGGDEINRPVKGGNHGWPEVSYGTYYWGGSFPASSRADTVAPLFYWDPSIAPSGMTIYSGKLWPEWQGDIFVGALKYQLVSRVDVEDGRLGSEERLFTGEYGRIRDVREGPEGALWFLGNDGVGSLYRITPAE